MCVCKGHRGVLVEDVKDTLKQDIPALCQLHAGMLIYVPLDRGRGGTVTGSEISAFIGLSSQTDVQKESQKCGREEGRGSFVGWEGEEINMGLTER